MTAQKSTGKKSFMLNYYLYKLRKNKYYFILYFILSMLVIPLLTIYGTVCIRIMNSFADCTTMREVENSEKVFQSLTESEPVFIVITGIAFIAAAILTIAVINSVFSYNVKKCDSDMYLSLPVSANQRFFADLGVTVSVCVVPMAICGAVSLLFSSLFSVGADKAITELKADTPNYCTYGYYSQRREIFNDFSGIIAYLLLMSVIVILGTVLFGVLINSVCGKPGDSVAYTVFGVMIFPFVAFSLYAILTDGTVGAVVTSFDITDAIFPVAPVGTGIAGLNFLIQALSSDLIGKFDIFSLQNVLFLLIVFASYIILAFLANKKRKAEKTGSHFVFPIAYHVMTMSLIAGIFGLVFCGNALGYRFHSTEIIIITIMTAVGYIIFELVRGIGLKKLWQTVIRFALAVGGTFLICLTVKATGAFGYSYYIPSVDDIESVTIDSEILCNDGDNGNYYTIKDKEFISVIRDYQSFIIGQPDIKTEPPYIDTCEGKHQYINYDLRYTLTNGKTYERKYQLTVTADNYAEYAKALYDMRQKCFKTEGYFDNLRKTIEGASQAEIIIHKDRDDIFGRKLAPEFTDKLLTALYNDFKAGRNTGRLKAVIGVNDNNGNNMSELISVEIRENCTETLSLINDENNSAERKQEYYEFKKAYDAYILNDFEGERDPWAYVLAYGDDISILPYGMSTAFMLELLFADLEREEVKELEKLYRLYDYYCDGPIFEAGAIVWAWDNALFSGADYYIPEENKAMSDRLLKELSEKLNDQTYHYG